MVSTYFSLNLLWRGVDSMSDRGILGIVLEDLLDKTAKISQ